MANSKITDISSLMHSRPAAGTGPALPGVHGARVAAAPPVAEPPAPEEDPPAEAPAPAEEADPEAATPASEAPEEPVETKAEKPAQKKAPAKKTTKKQEPAAEKSPETDTAEQEVSAEQTAPAAKKTASKRGPATQKKAASTAKDEVTVGEGAAEEQELVSLDGRPARLWDISGGKELPEGWARTALERVSKASRHFRADRRNTTLPDNIYDACNEFIYQEGKSGGLDLTLSNLAEAAYEQIPNDDEAGITRLLDGLPDKYFEKGLATRPRTFQLYEPTLEHMQNLARMLRAFGFTGKTGLVQTAALRELLLDLGVSVDED